MAEPSTELDTAAAPRGPDRSINVRRITFVEEALDSTSPRRRFDHPRRMFAVEVAPDPVATASGESPEALEVVVLTAGPSGGSLPQARAWMAQSPPTGPELPLHVDCKDGAAVEWQPGRAIVRGSVTQADELLAALIDFAYYEGELRILEEIVESREPQAEQDVSRAHRISRRDRAHWARIGDTIERLSRARLAFARLEAAITRAPGSSPPLARRLLEKLIDRSELETRLEVLSDRLETLEDLYEGANDRIADYRGWHKGHILEVVIAILLVLEVALVSVDLSFRYFEFQQEKAAAEADRQP